MPKYLRSDIIKLVVGQLVSELRSDSIVDIDECEFIDKAMELQKEIAAFLAREYLGER